MRIFRKLNEIFLKGGEKVRLPELGKRGGNTSCFCTFCIQNQKNMGKRGELSGGWEFFFWGGRVLSRKPPTKTTVLTGWFPCLGFGNGFGKRVPRHFGFSEPGTPVAGMGVGWLASSVWKLGKQHRWRPTRVKCRFSLPRGWTSYNIFV